jgi:hypothetical protein
MYLDFEFLDFNNDVLDDIVIYQLSNVPDVANLLLFKNTTMCFNMVNGFDAPSNPQAIVNTYYCYFYH